MDDNPCEPMTAIGIDIGGTKIALAVVDHTGRIHAKHRLATNPIDGFEIALGRIGEAVEQLLLQVGRGSIGAIGIGCTGPIDPQRGTIHNPHTLPTWDDCDLVTPLREKFGMRVVMENDADAAAIGEFRFGAGRGSSPVVMLTFGTGVGFAAIIDGRIYRGVDGTHPELGHIATSLDGPACYCGICGCLESLASGTAILSQGMRIGLNSCQEVFASALSGDARAKAIVGAALNATASAAWTLAHSFVPQRIVMGGGLMDDHFDLFANAINEKLSNAVMLPRNSVRVVRAELGVHAGVVGAASLVMDSIQ